MATLPVGDRGQKKKRIITLVLMAIFLMSASFFLIDRKEETMIYRLPFQMAVSSRRKWRIRPRKLLVGLAFRETLPTNSGLLYIFESTGQNHIWTKGYRFSVDIMWIE